MHLTRVVIKASFALFALMNLSFSDAVHAQCGAGIPSGGNPSCIPPDVYHNQGITNQSTPSVQQPIIIRHEWADRWGAISSDGAVGSLGFVTGYPDKKSAEMAAIRECLRGGGHDCRKDYSFRNGCAAFVVSNDGAIMVSAENENKAADIAFKRCANKYGVCQVYKTACSHAEAVPIR